MGGKSTTESQTQQTQNSTTAPWQPTQGILQNILTSIGNDYLPAAKPTGAEQGALGTIRSNAQSAPSYGGEATGLATDLMRGGIDRTGYAAGAYDRLGASLAPTIAGDYLDPNKNPFFANTTNAISRDIENRVGGLFAGAGRDLSGAHMGTLAREITNATAPIYSQVYNTERGNQLDAMKAYYGAGGQTAGILSGLDQTALGNRAQGLDTAINGVPQATNANATGILNAESLARSIPLSNLAGILGLTLPIAGLGSQSSGTMTGNTQGSYTMSPAQQAWGWMNAAGSMFAPRVVR